MLVYMGSNFEELRSEILRQDGKHGPFQGTRLGRSRLALACLEDEIDEAKEAWRTERKSLHWHNARTEVLQVAAVAMRALRDAFPVPNVMREESRIVTTVQTLDASDGGTR